MNTWAQVIETALQECEEQEQEAQRLEDLQKVDVQYTAIGRFIATSEQDDLIEVLDMCRERTKVLIAHPELDADTVDWIVNSGRFGGSHFVKITPTELKNLQNAQLKVYAHIKRVQAVDGGWCKDSTQRISTDCGIGHRTVERVLPQMVEDNKLHKRETRPVWDNDAWEQNPHWYRVNEPSHWGTKLLLLLHK